jgi:hypothetical protein
MRRSASRNHLIIAAFLVILGAYTIWRFGIDQIQPPGFVPRDFDTFYKASQRVAAGENPYLPDEPSPFKYSPTFLLAFSATLAKLPKETSWLIWCVLSVLVCFGSWNAIFKITLADCAPRPTVLAALLAAFTVFGWHGYLEHFSYGQADFFVVGAFLLSAAFVARNRMKPTAAALLSFALVTKPQAALLLAPFAVLREYRLLAYTFGFTSALLLLPGVFWGFGRLLSLFSLWRECLSHQSVEFLIGNLNQSLAACLGRWFGKPEAVTALMPMVVAAALIGVAALAWRWRSASRLWPEPKARLAVAALPFYAIVSPLGWRWLTFIWIPAGVVAASAALKKRSRPALILLSLFALNGLLLQAIIAHALGIREVDDLSLAGMYCVGNLLLLAASATTATGD